MDSTRIPAAVVSRGATRRARRTADRIAEVKRTSYGAGPPVSIAVRMFVWRAVAFSGVVARFGEIAIHVRSATASSVTYT